MNTPRQHTDCPTCGAPVPGMLAGCRQPACRAADIAAETALDLRTEGGR